MARCKWRGIARTPEQREAAVRFWLDLDEDEALPLAAEVERRFMDELERTNPVYPETVRSNFLAIAQGGLTTDYTFLTCYAVREYILGSGPTGSTTLSVAYDRMGESRSYEMYKQAHEGGEFGSEALMTEAEYAEWRSQLVSDVELVLSLILEGRQSVLFLAPMGAHNAIAVEAWQVVAQWDVQRSGTSTVAAVRYGAPAHGAEHTQTLANLKSRITTATAATSTATTTPARIPNVGGLRQYYRDIGAYGDITPDDGETTTFTPAQPPGVPTCLGSAAVSDPRLNPGLVRDCTVLLDTMDTLAGTATLDWSATTTISSWEGVTLNASSTRIAALDLDDEGLDGSIPLELGGLSALATLDLSDNDLTGEIPLELGWLYNLEVLRLSGNRLTGCIPIALEDVATNDLASLGLLYCRTPAPENLRADTLGEVGIGLSWDAVPDAGTYRVEYRAATSTGWTVDVETSTTTAHTVDGLTCGSGYDFRVSAYGSGVTYAAAWSAPSAALSAETVACPRPPEFDAAPYTFSIAEDAEVGAPVGAVSATDPDGDAVTYSIAGGDEDGRFAMATSTGAITVAGELDHETTPSHTLTAGASDGKGGTATTTVEIAVTNVIELPGAPQNLRATTTGAWVRLEWDAPDDATVTGYQVLRRQPSIHEVGEFEVHEEDTGSADTVYVDTRVEPETRYVYRVKAVNADGAGRWSNYAAVTTGAPAAPAPEDVRATLSEGAFTITWRGVSGADRYEAQYRTDGGAGDWASAATTTATVVTFSPEGGPACGTTYEFRVRSYGDGTAYAAAWGLPSDAETVTTARCNLPPEFGTSTYSFLVVEGTATSTVVGAVLATDPDDDMVSYTITAGNEDGRFAIATSTGAISLSSSIVSAAGTTYSLRVEASDGYGGAASAAVTVTVAAPTCSGGIAVPDPAGRPGLVSDCETLLGARDALAGTATLNWEGATAITSWDGVTVDGTPGRVTGLSLRNRGLTGEIPSALGDLAALVELNLSVNRLTGAIPTELGNLSNLTTLRLQDNQLSGGIPTELGNLSNLTYLWLQDNQLSGGIPTELGGLANLIWLILSGNGLVGAIPPQLGDLTYLSHLWLQDNQLSGEIPSGLGGLTDMSILRLHNNRLSGPIPWQLGGLSGLSILHISGNPLAGCVPPALRSVSNNDFSSLGLPYCTREGPVPAPSGLSVSSTADAFTIGWDAVPEAGLYEVQQRIEGSGDEWARAATTTATAVTYSPAGGPVCETTYEFRVRAYGDGATYGGGWGHASGVETATTGACNRDPEFATSTYAFSVPENAATSTVVGTVSATDPDEGDAVTYSIASGNEDGRLSIATSTGEITVETALDHESAPSYTLTVEASDGRGGTDTAIVEIDVTDVAEELPPAPQGVSVSLSDGAFTIVWDPVAGAAWYEAQHRISGSEDDWASVATTTAAAVTYSPEGGPACGTTYEFRVRAYGDGMTYGGGWGHASGVETATTGACNRDPEFATSTYAFSVPENAATSTVVGTVSATDPDEGDAVTYSITAGDEDGRLSIATSTGEITVETALDHESAPSYTLTVEASDGRGGTDTAIVEIDVTDVAEELPPAPQGVSVSLSDGAFTIVWNPVAGAAWYEAQRRISASGDDWASVATTTASAVTYSPAGGPACGTTYEFRVRAYGDGTVYVAGWGVESGTEPVTTEACNRAPEFGASRYSFSIAENAATSTVAGTVSATDADAGDTVMYSIPSGNEGGDFSIIAGTGEITVAGALDHETVPLYTLTVEASDGRGGTDTATVEVAVTDVAEDPPPAPQSLGVTLTDDTFSISWNAVSGAALYEVQFRIDGSGEDWAGAATTTATALTYSPEGGPECGTTYEFRVRTYGDGAVYVAGWGAESDVEPVTTSECDRAPRFRSSMYSFSIAENAATSTSVGTVSATDADGDTVTYSVTGGNEEGKFSIGSGTGQISLAGAVDPDVLAFYALKVEANDGNGNTGTATVGVSLLLEECSNGTVVPRPRNNPELVRDCSMLLAARGTLAGEGSLDWSAETRIHDWQGVTVEPRPFLYVRVLYLTELGLTGSIPPELGGLADVRRIDLDYNMLTGGIPRELGSLPDLELLYLQGNRLSGEIPAELGNLRNLQVMYFSDNGLAGGIPTELGRLRNLQQLILDGNPLEGEIPPELGNLTRLEHLLLRDNGLTGGIPAELEALPNLRHLYLEGNGFTGCIPAGLQNVDNNDLDELGLAYCASSA